MKTATLLFTYNRSYHTKQVIDALKQSTVLPQKLLVFQDGLKQNENADEWKNVNDLIRGIDWCEREIIESEYNKGLADSIVSGIDYAFKEYDAVIVLEDDCVPMRNFISFMQQCFEKYRNSEKVYSVSGYSWPINLEKGQYDIYGCGRISSWGWGTWKDRWEKYRIDGFIVKRLKRDRVQSYNLAVWGSDGEEMLLDNITGKNDSWAVYWMLNVIEKEGICINPYDSLIQNIGMDGSGTNCGKTDRFQTAVSKSLIDKFSLPDEIQILDSTEKSFADLYGSYTAVNKADESKEKVLIYGLGNFYLQNQKVINEHFYVEAFIDKRKHGWFAGKKIIKPDETGQYIYGKIIIMIMDVQECINIIKELIENKVSYNQIILGHSLFGHYSQCLDQLAVTPDGNLSVTVGGITVKVQSMDEFNNVYEVLVQESYQYFINNKKKDIVLDIGMNVGDATLYFLHNDKVEKVYAYEPFKETYLAAKENLKQYLEDSGRLEIFQYGISHENSRRTLGFNCNMTCGQSTIANIRENAYGVYQTMGLVRAEDEKTENIEVRSASDVILPIIQRHSNCNIILKMDCEGEEYGIIENLLQEGILAQISFIMMEWHYKGKEGILRFLEEAGFSCWCSNKTEDMGLIYGYKMKKGGI